jgi:hypothetical protein
MPSACGRLRADGLWEGWIEFEPARSAKEALRTGRESVQPNRDDLMYWAQGLTQTYLEGALDRALYAEQLANRHLDVGRRARIEEASAQMLPNEPVAPRAVLNPYDVYLQGEDILVRQLAAMSEERLREIAVAYGFVSREAANRATGDRLSSSILGGVRGGGAPTRP